MYSLCERDHLILLYIYRDVCVGGGEGGVDHILVEHTLNAC